MTYGQQLAAKDFEAYKKGEMTKEDLKNACQYSQWAAAFGDLEAQEIGSDYLYKMEELGFIKNLHRVN